MVQTIPQPLKNPGISMLLNVFWPGAGQIYNGQVLKGICVFVGMMLSVGLIWFVIGFVTTPILWVWMLYDARKSALQVNASITGQLEHRERLAGGEGRS